MMRRSSLFVPLVLIPMSGLCFVSTSAHAGGTRNERISDFDDFDEGESDGAAIESSGKLTVGYAAARSPVEDAHAAYSCLSHKGDVYVGTADKAGIRKVSSGKKTPKVEDFAQLDGAVVTAMTALPSGDLVVATLPGGVLQRVDKRGKVTEFAKLDVQRIWALAMHEGRLMVGTGPKGELYSLSPDGKDAKVVLDVDEKDVLSLLSIDGQIIAGVSPQAKAYRVTDELSGVLVQDFKGDEVRALVATRDGLLAAVNEFEERDINTLKNLEKSLNRASITGDAPATISTSSKQPKADAAVYHVDLRGAGSKRDIERATEATWEKWLDKSGQYFTDMIAVEKDRTVLVSSSRAGKVYRVRGRRDVSTINDLEERQATSLCKVGGKKRDKVFATAGDGAAVYELAAAPAAKAVWTSTVYDAEQPATYGAVRILADGKFKLRARSGPSDEADDRWSDWKTVPLTATKADHRGRIDVPRRRYLQLEVSLETADTEVRAIEFFFAPENLAPRLTAVEFDSPSFDTDDDGEPEPNAKVKWNVEAMDDDDLVYGVRIRNEGGGDDEWVPLHEGDEPITKKELEVDLSTLPDGVYEIEVVASDEPSNGSARARTDELRSDPVVVDRTRPTLSGVNVSGNEVTGRASDTATYIHDVSFAIDGGSFRAASPGDGIFDGQNEDFKAVLPGDLRPGKHRLVVRARDAHGNITTQALVISR